MKDKPRPGRPTETVNSKMMDNGEVLVKRDNKVTLQEVANQLSIGKASVIQILHKGLGRSKIKSQESAKTADRRPKGIQGDHSKRMFEAF